MSLSYYRMVDKADDSAEYLAIEAKGDSSGPLWPDCGFVQVESYKDGEPTYEELVAVLVQIVQAKSIITSDDDGHAMYQIDAQNRASFDLLAKLGRVEYVFRRQGWARLK